MSKPAQVEEDAQIVDAIVVAHDFGGFHCARHRQLVDAFASQGWLAILPDFSPTSSDRHAWFECIRLYCVDFLLPWLGDDQEIEAIQIFAVGGGGIPCAHATAGVAERLSAGARVPRLFGATLVYPVFDKPHVLNKGEFQKMVANLPDPMLIMPAVGDSQDVRMGGLLQAILSTFETRLEFMAFEQAAHGFMSDTDVEKDEVRSSTAWAIDAACEFFHRNFVTDERRVPRLPPTPSDESSECEVMPMESEVMTKALTNSPAPF